MAKIMILVGLLLGMLLTGCSVEQNESALPIPDSGHVQVVADEGYDMVEYFTASKAVKGNPQIELLWQGAKYYFTTNKNKEAFANAPEKFAAAFGSHCPVSLANGGSDKGKPTNWSIFEGKLYFFWNENNKNAFEADPKSVVQKAEAQFKDSKTKTQ
jgi:YHS domain-containing protein